MKNIFCLLILLAAGFSVKSQITGGFYTKTDYYGNVSVYFKGENTSPYNYNITIEAVNDLTEESNSWNCTPLKSGMHFTIGIEDNWMWLAGEKLYITYENGKKVYWIYTPSTYMPTPVPNITPLPNNNTQPRTCSSCYGKGTCSWCGGSGKYEYNKNGRCLTCRGNGRCVGCNGKGHY